MSEYVPTTRQIRYASILGMTVANGDISERDSAQLATQFDRWLAEHDREVAANAFAEGRATEACDAAISASTGTQVITPNPYKPKGEES